ncbi:cation:proton antiporter [Pararobbsia silviterrae]|uniref:Sodium:proton exchanger n=1 Tax=Pararobbsia silviterrae TaxID=1792498 RepID=A0A494Y712_9BURK|nr:cation:proton antiporter [Pararobbsia silviterrae]RKP58509.1 sodium:proton exchanger [Pararobbsia silviterrae]
MKSAFAFLPGWPLTLDLAFWVGLTLFAAGICGELCWRAWRVPRLIGYGVIGLVAGPAGLGVIDTVLADDARWLMDIAIGLLLFELGSRVSLRWIRLNPWLVAMSVGEAALTFIAVWFVLHVLHVQPMTAAVAATIAMATSPAMIIQLRSELKSEGQVTERLMTLSALNSMYAVVVLKLLSGWIHQEFYGNVWATLIQPPFFIVGSLLLAYGLAISCNFLFRRISSADEHSFVVLFGLILLAIAIAHTLKLSTIMALLAAGIIFKNLDPRPQLWPTHFGTAGWLLTVVLFGVTLVSFEWKYIALGGIAALALVGARFVAKLAGVLLFARSSGLGWKQGGALGVALSPMSALAFLLVSDTYTLYPNFDPALRAIIMCSIALLQLVAPLLIYRALAAVNERGQ